MTRENLLRYGKEYLHDLETACCEIGELHLNFVRESIKALEQEPILDKIRAEIERLHYHPKLDFIKNDEVVEMALDIIDKYKAESEGKE